MSTLVLRLSAPLQSWGIDATQRWRPTSRLPTRSGVVGMLNACLGVPVGGRHSLTEDVELLVRVDRPGRVEEDYHTVTAPPADVAASRQRAAHLRSRTGQSRQDWVVPVGNGSPWVVSNAVNTLITKRLMLADAEFILAIGSPDAEQLSAAVHTPVFTPYLGRKAYAPTFPFHLGVRDADPAAVLTTLASTSDGPKPVHRIDHDRISLLERAVVPHTPQPLIDWKTP